MNAGTESVGSLARAVSAIGCVEKGRARKNLRRFPGHRSIMPENARNQVGRRTKRQSSAFAVEDEERDLVCDFRIDREYASAVLLVDVAHRKPCLFEGGDYLIDVLGLDP